MAPIKYPYSMGRVYLTAVLYVIGILLWVFMIWRAISINYLTELIAVPCFFATMFWATRFSRQYFFPFINNNKALELDNNKLQFGVDKTVIYWKNVKTLDYIASERFGWRIVFKMADGTNDIFVPIKYVAGNDADIYNAIVAYFENQL